MVGRSFGFGAAFLIHGGFFATLFAPAGDLDAAATRVLVIPASEFQLPRDARVEVSGSELYAVGRTPLRLRAPLVLPNGTQITSMDLNALDEHATRQMVVAIYAVPNDHGPGTVLGQVNSIFSPGEWGIFSPGEWGIITVDNTRFSYYLDLYLPATGNEGLRFSHVKLYCSGRW